MAAHDPSLVAHVALASAAIDPLSLLM